MRTDEDAAKSPRSASETTSARSVAAVSASAAAAPAGEKPNAAIQMTRAMASNPPKRTAAPRPPGA